MKTRDLTLKKIFEIYKELLKEKMKVVLYINDMNIYKQLCIFDYSGEESKILFTSKLYKNKYFDKQISNYVSYLKFEELPY